MTQPTNQAGRALWAALAATILFGVGARLALAFLPGYETDQLAWARYSRYIVTHGLPHVYELTLGKPSLGIYPPVYHALLGGMGIIYQRFFSSEFLIPSRSLLFLMKLVPITGDCLLGLVMFLFVRRAATLRSAALTSMLFLLNPAIVFNSAYWGMFGDPFYTLFIVLSLIALFQGRPNWSAAAMVLALATKPQAAAVVPAVAYGILRSTRPSRWWLAAATAALVVGLISLPYIWTGTLGESVAALWGTIGLFPVLSANAHNTWFLVSMGDSWIRDDIPLVGAVTARLIGMAAFGMACVLGLLAMGRPTDKKRLFEISAYLAFAFFVLLTEMHENYLYPAVTLATLASWHSRRIRFLAVGISLTWFANLILHDSLGMESFQLADAALARLRLANSAIIVALFAIWTGPLIRDAWSTWSRPVGRALELDDAP